MKPFENSSLLFDASATCASNWNSVICSCHWAHMLFETLFSKDRKLCSQIIFYFTKIIQIKWIPFEILKESTVVLKECIFIGITCKQFCNFFQSNTQYVLCKIWTWSGNHVSLKNGQSVHCNKYQYSRNMSAIVNNLKLAIKLILFLPW